MLMQPTELQDPRVMGAPRKLGTNIQKLHLRIAEHLDIHRVVQFSIPVVLLLQLGWHDIHVGAVDGPNDVWEPGKLIKLALCKIFLSLITGHIDESLLVFHQSCQYQFEDFREHGLANSVTI